MERREQNELLPDEQDARIQDMIEEGGPINDIEEVASSAASEQRSIIPPYLIENVRPEQLNADEQFRLERVGGQVTTAANIDHELQPTLPLDNTKSLTDDEQGGNND